jgi:hypothetical protein
MTRRDLATIGCYVTIFAAVVVWASLRPTRDDGPRQNPRHASSSDAQLERSEGIPLMRHIVEHITPR